MLALEIGKRRRREAVGELGVAHVRPAQQRALYGVVREDKPFGQAGAAVEQGAHVDDALPGEPAAPGQIHPHLAAGAAVRVYAPGPGHGARKARTLARGELYADARVDYASARGHHAALFVDLGAVERVQHRAYQLPRRAGQERSVRVQGENIACARYAPEVPGHALELAVLPGAQRRQGHERAAFALVRRPYAVALVLAARPDKQVKAAAVFPVQAVYGAFCALERRGVVFGLSAPGLRQIGEQREMQIFPALARSATEGLQSARELLAVGARGEYARDGQDGLALVRHALIKRHARHYARRQHVQKQRVEGVLRELQRRQQRKQRRPHASGDKPCGGAYRGGKRHGAKRVEHARRSLDAPAQRLHQYPPAHVRALRVGRVLLRELQHPRGALELAHSLACGYFSQSAAVERAGALVHERIRPRRVAREHPPGEVRAVYQLAQIRRRECPEACNGRGDALRVRRSLGKFLVQQLDQPRPERRAQQSKFAQRERRHTLIAVKVRRGVLCAHVAGEPVHETLRGLADKRVHTPGAYFCARIEVPRGGERLALDKIPVVRKPLPGRPLAVLAGKYHPAHKLTHTPRLAAGGKISGPGNLFRFAFAIF